MKRLRITNIIFIWTITIILLQLAGCSGGDTKPDYSVKTETGEADKPKKEVKEGKEVEKPAESVEKDEAVGKVSEAEDFMLNKGIGPVKSLELGELNQVMADEGKIVYDRMCSSCHKPTRRFVGPAPKGILERRSPEWVMNMILNPEQMVKEDPIAKALLIEYNLSPMANQNLTEEEARKILEYFRTL